MAGNLVVSTINGVAIGTKNALINGNFGINQRGVSGTVTLAAGAYGHDRWKAGSSGCTYTFSTSENVTTITISAGSLMQVIEGLNLQSGTYILSWTGTAQGKIDAGSYGNSGITGTAVGGTNQTIEFGTGTLSLAQYEKGSTATSFDYRPYGTELALCQRYYWRLNSTGSTTYVAIGSSGNSTRGSYALKAPVTLRATPSISFSGISADDGGTPSTVSSTSVAGAFVNTDVVSFSATGSATLTTGRAAILRVGASSTNYIDFSAEL